MCCSVCMNVWFLMFLKMLCILPQPLEQGWRFQIITYSNYLLNSSLLYKLLSLSPEREDMESKGVTHPGVEKKGRLCAASLNPRI